LHPRRNGPVLFGCPKLPPPLRSFQKGHKALANVNSRYLPPPTTITHERPLMRALSICSHRTRQTLAGRAPASKPAKSFSMPNILTSDKYVDLTRRFSVRSNSSRAAGLDPPMLLSDSELELPPLSPLHTLMPDNL